MILDGFCFVFWGCELDGCFQVFLDVVNEFGVVQFVCNSEEGWVGNGREVVGVVFGIDVIVVDIDFFGELFVNLVDEMFFVDDVSNVC